MHHGANGLAGGDGVQGGQRHRVDAPDRQRRSGEGQAGAHVDLVGGEHGGGPVAGGEGDGGEGGEAQDHGCSPFGKGAPGPRPRTRAGGAEAGGQRPWAARMAAVTAAVASTSEAIMRKLVSEAA